MWTRLSIVAFSTFLNLVAANPAEVEPGPEVGAVAPALELTGLDGKLHSLAEHRGKVVLVNFWGTWCPPCLREMPALERLHKRMAGRPFAILAVDPKQPESDVARYVRALGITFTVLLDPAGETAMDWHIKVYPTTYLVDADGRIRYRSVGPEGWDSAQSLERIEQLMPDRKPPAPRGSPAR
jgi:DsbE subfamily thiol:disulfide oxidoreductase